MDTEPQATPGKSAAVSAPSDPTSVRPDLPWLAELEKPGFPVRWDERVIKYLEFYKKDPRGRNIMGAWIRDQGKYRDLILEHLRKAGLPDDLIYLCMIESSYDPHEYSRAGASGLWQFMRKGGRVYGLRIDHWVDERNDPVRSTEAAMLYWSDLYQRFGNWDLVMAAYNAGYAGVLRSVAKYNTNDFWQLLDYENALPWGSSIYVPKALAAAIVGHNRKLFGYDQIKDAERVEWDTVKVPKSVSLKVIARAAGVDLSEIEALNPHLRRGRTPPREKGFPVRVPRGTKKLFGPRFSALRPEWDLYDTYTVSHGERFEDIATMHGISRTGLRELNGMTHESDAHGGLVLVVPRVSAADKKRNLERAREKLYASGHPKGRPGEKLIVAVPDKSFHVAGKKRVFYRVVAGDTQYGVASAFGVDRFDLARWNRLDPESYLHPRMVLMVFVDPKRNLKARKIKLLDEDLLIIVNRGSKEHLELAEARMGRERKVYRAKRRESFAQIAKRYGLTDHDLARINRMPRNTVLEKGDEIIVYKVVDASRSDRAEKQARRARKNAPKKKKKPKKKQAKRGKRKS
jgi:membrane-bound lytic murein transglycosylase D